VNSISSSYFPYSKIIDVEQNVKSEKEFVKELYKNALDQQDFNKKAKTIILTGKTSDTTESSYLVVVKKGFFKSRIESILKINLESFQTLSEEANDFVGKGSLKTALRVQDIKNQNTDMVVVIFRDKTAQELGLEGAIKTSKQFKNPQHFAFGTWIKFDVENLDGTTTTREAYLGTEKKLGDFQQYLESNPDLSEQKKIQMLLPAVKGTQKMHQKGVIHRDLKPENLLLDESGAKIADPDTAIKATKRLNFSGTVLYMAPEIFKNIQPDDVTGEIKIEISPQAALKTDVWSWGAIFYKTATNMDLIEILEKKMSDESESYEDTSSHSWDNWDWDEEESPGMCMKPSTSISLVESQLQNLSFNKKVREFKNLSTDHKVLYLNKLQLNEQKRYLRTLSKENRREVQQRKMEIANKNYNIYIKFIRTSYESILKIHQFLEDNYQAIKPNLQKAPLEYLAWRCVNPNPKERPSMEEVVRSLKQILL
jgi:serine/threonine protein kinase